MTEPDRPTEARPASAFTAGPLKDRYEILEKIGRGGFGEVWKARDTILNRLVAIKRLPPDAATDSAARERLRREALSASALNHSNICTVYDLATVEGEHFLVMEYIEGRTIHELLADGPLAADRAGAIALQVAEALEEAHRGGIIHRDIKSTNIILTPQGQAKVLDFGLAKQLESIAPRSAATEMLLTREGTTVGTLHYMSPEQLLGEPLDGRTDVFSLGVVLYEMLTARRPFTGSSAVAVADAILHQQPQPLGDDRRIPAAFQSVITRALAKDRNERLASASDFAAALRPATTSRRGSAWRAVAAAAVTLAVIGAAAGAIWWKRAAPLRWAQQIAIPDMESLLARDQYAEAFRLATQLQSVIPGHPSLVRALDQSSLPSTITSTPAGAAIYWKRYDEPEQRWTYLGTTPLESVRFPRGLYLQLQARKPGYVVADRVWPIIGATGGSRQLEIPLLPTASATRDMVFVPDSKEFTLPIPGIDHLPAVALPGFLIDQYEVSNEQFKHFVDAGGYEKEEYWREPFVENGKRVPWPDAMKRLVDATGHSGPATWELGSYPSGQGSFPVSGVSWYEAAAYARFVGKRLPTIHHWSKAAVAQASAVMAPKSNFGGRGLEPVTTRRAMNGYGTFDMGGNVKEWCTNEAEGGKRYILGGAWDEPSYMFIDSDAQSPWSRGATYGFRCMQSSEAVPAAVEAPVYFESRDFSKEQPVGDALFQAYLGFYSYDKTPLEARVVSRDTSSPDWTHEEVTMKAAYGNEQLIVHIYVPRNARPPFQPVLYFPGSSAIHLDKFTGLTIYSDFIPRSGRALVFPIYKGTFERGDALKSDYPEPTSFYRDHVVAWTKDARRAIDYLETRPDMNVQKLSLIGFSWGGVIGPIIAAIEPRIRTSVFVVGGFCFQRALPEVDQINFVPRVKQPTLMLNARYDHFFPLETSAKAMFRLLGTPEADKRFLLYDSGHALPRNEVIKESVAWLNAHLGAPAR